MCVFYYGDVGVRKDAVIEDVHVSKLELNVGLNVDVLIVRTYPALGLSWKNQIRVK